MFPEVITTALKNTILYTACGFTFGLALGLVLALMRLSSVGPVPLDGHHLHRVLPRRCRPWWCSSPSASASRSPFPGCEVPGGVLGIATLALGLVGGAYMAETIRAGIQAVPKGQMEAARSLGMSGTVGRWSRS